jgi:hypothetical protein
MWQLADDSGCLLDDAVTFKYQLYPSEASVTVEMLEERKNALADAGHLIRYEAQGKKCLFITAFHENQALRHCAAPEVPLPFWVHWVQNQQKYRSGEYVIGDPYSTSSETVSNCTVSVMIGTDTVRGSGYGSGSILGSGSNKNDDVVSTPPVTSDEQSILDALKDIPGYPFQIDTDLDFVKRLRIEFQGVDILPIVEDWRTWLIDHPGIANWRQSFRNRVTLTVTGQFRNNDGGKGNDRSDSTKHSSTVSYYESAINNQDKRFSPKGGVRTDS